MTRQNRSKRPPIHMIGSEAGVLADLALAAAERPPKVSEMLLDETSRAKFYTRERIPRDVVVMGATVEFDDANGSTRSVKTVCPNLAEISSWRVSILAPAGRGLIGLDDGQSHLELKVHK